MRKIKFREWLEEPDYSDIPVQIIYKLEDKPMRILKGYSKDEQKELENAKKYMGCSDLLHIITGSLPDTRCGSIKDKYYGADIEERISIIRDILDFYTDKAAFIVPRKYYVHLIKGDESSYLNISWRDDHRVAEVDGNFEFGGLKTKFTYDEVIAINPKFVPFMEEVEDDE